MNEDVENNNNNSSVVGGSTLGGGTSTLLEEESGTITAAKAREDETNDASITLDSIHKTNTTSSRVSKRRSSAVVMVADQAHEACLRREHIPPPSRIAMIIEVYFQNVYFANALIFSIFPGEDDAAVAVGPPFIFGVFQFFTSLIFGFLSWKMGWTYCAPDVGIRSMIFENWQRSNSNSVSFWHA